MSDRQRQQLMRGEAIQRVLARTMDRAAIVSLGDLRRAYEDELAAHGPEIAAKADLVLTRMREADQRQLGQYLRCANCGGPTGAKRMHRRYCSNRCRQQAYRQRLWEAVP
jgi:hypothetical protein